jgi:hypothetical protein
MATLRELLKLMPKDAARALVAKALRPGTDVNTLMLTAKGPLSTTRNFTILISQPRGMVKNWKYEGSHPFTFARLLWSDVFKDGFILLEEDIPSTMWEVLELIGKKYGIWFDVDDVDVGPALLSPDGSLKLKASLHSWRWFGMIDVLFSGAPASLIVPRSDVVTPSFVQKADPTKFGFGKLLYKLKRNTFLGHEGRTWWNEVNTAFGEDRMWVMDKYLPSPYNGGGARVLNNRLAYDAPKHLNLGPFPMKAEILLNRRLCTDVKGLLTIYYSRPEGV